MSARKTQLGKELDQLGSRTNFAKIRKETIKYGILQESINGKYIFMVRLYDDKGKLKERIGPIPLLDPPSTLAFLYGPPQDMESSYEVRVIYKGGSSNRGYAEVIKRIAHVSSSEEIEEINVANELPLTGVSFAPPGSGI